MGSVYDGLRENSGRSDVETTRKARIRIKVIRVKKPIVTGFKSSIFETDH